MIHKWYLSSSRATFYAETNDNGIITKVAPIAWRFKGQHINRLIKYFRIDRQEVI